LAYVTRGGYEETALWLVTGPLPAIASIAGAIGMAGIAAPLVKSRGYVVRTLATVTSFFIAALVLGGLQNTAQDWPLIRETIDPLNAQNLFGGLYSLAIALWLLRPLRRTPLTPGS
jgi:hypothetical protein